jgi:sporulation protein YlmC with PRC-barrel domain
MRTQVLSASSITNKDVVNPAGENLGNVKDVAIDLDEGRIAYAVLSYGGVLGVGDKLFAVPWDALRLDLEKDVFVLNVDKELLRDAPGFDEGAWPTTADRTFVTEVYTYYKHDTYW